MTELEKQIIETWQINHRTNMKLIENLTEETLNFTTSKRGGGTVGHQLVHIYNVRFWRLEKLEKSLIEGLSTIKATDEKNINMIKDLHEQSADLIEKFLQICIANEGEVKRWPRGVIPFLGYLIHHEAHHRGNIMLTLKLSGFKLPDDLKYGLWSWSKL